MAFERMVGIEGLVFVPEEHRGNKKHPCPDCYFCQMCSDNRCSLCLNRKSSDRDCHHTKNPGSEST
ncbi:MAG: hypothetical protein ACP5G0_05205 [Desulfomonilia bacterium]